MALPPDIQTHLNELLRKALEKKNFDDAKLYLDAGANINCTDTRDSLTPLVTSLIMHQHDVTDFLLKNGADIHKKNIHGSTPLHAAATGLNVAGVKLLLRAGVKTDVRDSTGHKAGEHAQGSIGIQIREMILDHEKKLKHPLEKTTREILIQKTALAPLTDAQGVPLKFRLRKRSGK